MPFYENLFFVKRLWSFDPKKTYCLIDSRFHSFIKHSYTKTRGWYVKKSILNQH